MKINYRKLILSKIKLSYRKADVKKSSREEFIHKNMPEFLSPSEQESWLIAHRDDIDRVAIEDELTPEAIKPEDLEEIITPSIKIKPGITRTPVKNKFL